MAVTTFDPAHTSPNITLSNGNLTALKVSGVASVYDNTYSFAAGTADKIYAEIQANNPSDMGIGIANVASMPADEYLGQTTTSFGWYAYAQLYYNNNVVGELAQGVPYYADNNWVAFAIDRTAGTFQLRNVTTGTPWSDAFSLAAFGVSPILVVASFYIPNEGSSVNFDGAFLGTVPPGYSRWGDSIVVGAKNAPALMIGV